MNSRILLTGTPVSLQAAEKQDLVDSTARLLLSG
jgi:hypothetical protein